MDSQLGLELIKRQVLYLDPFPSFLEHAVPDPLSPRLSFLSIGLDSHC